MSFLVGGGVAAFLAFFDLLVAQRYRPTAGIGWWLLRIGLDGAQGVIAIAALEVVALPMEGLSSPFTWVLAGAAAPRLVQGLEYGGRFDLKAIVDRLRIPLEDRIDSASAVANAASDRRSTQALIDKGITPAVLAKELQHAMKLRRALSTKLKDVEYIRDTAESDRPEEEQLRILVMHAREIQLLGTVRHLKRS